MFPKLSMKVDHMATHIQTVWKMSIILDKFNVSSSNNDCNALVIPQGENLYGEIQSVQSKEQNEKCLPDPYVEGCLLDTFCSILRFERPRSQRALIKPDDMRLKSLSSDHTDAYTDAKRLPRRTAPNVFGMSTNDIVFREWSRTKEIAVGKLRLT